MSEYEDLWSQPETQGFLEHALREMAPKIASSAVVCSIVGEDRVGDAKFWVELGASICMDKPIVLLVVGDAPVPQKLLAIADEVVRCPPGGIAEEGVADQIAAVMKRVIEKAENG